jgi:hypothetical protein
MGGPIAEVSRVLCGVHCGRTEIRLPARMVLVGMGKHELYRLIRQRKHSGLEPLAAARAAVEKHGGFIAFDQKALDETILVDGVRPVGDFCNVV